MKTLALDVEKSSIGPPILPDLASITPAALQLDGMISNTGPVVARDYGMLLVASPGLTAAEKRLLLLESRRFLVLQTAYVCTSIWRSTSTPTCSIRLSSR